MTKRTTLFALIVGQVFLWTGSAFISVLYRLLAFYAPAQVTLLTEVLYYAAQAVGIGVFALLLRRRPAFAGGRRFVAAALAITFVFTVAAILLNDGILVMLVGLAMNVCVGLLSGAYLTRLSSQIPMECRGRVFGLAYAIGSIGTWLISLPFGGTLLQGNWSLGTFFVLAALSVVLVRFLEPITPETEERGTDSVSFDRKFILLALSVPLLCSVVNGLGYFFSAADVSTVYDPVFTRMFYAVGLIVAGIVSDKNRRYGAVCCIVALIFPFISLALKNEVDASAVMSAFSFIFYGFFSVYRVVLFADIAAKHAQLLPLAVFGMLVGRLGDCLGTLGGIYLEGNQVVLTCLNAAAFILCALLFFALYHRLYMPTLPERENTEALLSAYEAHSGFTAQQCRIFRLVVKGCSNSEIATELFLTESTVKFHMRNILKRTGCTNRTELISDFKSMHI
ncbi:MAG: hypothetical protein GXX92_11905 [Clostridiales bacterium]|nr:hypothetical protein [Clostridiales bacterium]